MPPSIKGKLLTKFLRNGTPLCALYQTGQCFEDPCPEAHVCAVISRTGRACGGRHPAQECWARRAKTVEGEVAAPVLPEPSSARPGEDEASPVPGLPESSSEESVTPPTRKRPAPQPETIGKKLRLGQRAPVTPPKAAPKTPPKAAAPTPAPAPPSDPAFLLPEMPATLDPPMEEVVWDRLSTVHGKFAQAPTKIFENSCWWSDLACRFANSRKSGQIPCSVTADCLLHGET